MKQIKFSVAEAAEYKGVSRTALYDAIASKRLPRRYSRGRLVITESDLVEWEQSKRKRGRTKGKAINEEHKARIAEGLKRRWQERKQNRKAASD